ncbi:MAG: acyl-CoA dehydrogenase family protein [Dehalococcoidia bacterium]
MRFAFTPEEEAFREEVREFIRTELPPDYENVVGGTSESWEIETSTRKKLADKGWLTMSWPKEYGGQNAPVMKQVIFRDEWSYAHAPGWDGEGIGFIGPAIMVHGTEEQKIQHIGGIARGEVIWCQGYSEPEAGSDLGSLKTRAEEDGDDYVINGQKIWTSQAHYADWILFLARTDPDAPKHRGITMFLADMKTPGITVRPIINMTGSHEFNETFFDNVRVPKKNIVGELNRGWYAGMTLLDFERSGIEYASYTKRALDEIIKYARETKANGKTLIEVPTVRNKLSQMAVEIEISYMISYNIAWLQSKGEIPNKEASIGKLFGTELEQRMARMCMEILGLHGQLARGSRRAPLNGVMQRSYLGAVSSTIAGGTSEIQRNIISTRGLGLPRA